MKKKIHMSLDDIIFEHRNKAYGAYALRQEYRANLTKAAVIGSLSMITVFLSSFVVNKKKPIEPKTGHIYKIVELDKITESLQDVEDPPEKAIVEKPK